MTPSIDDIRSDDELLDALGARQPVAGDPVAAMLSAWTHEIDTPRVQKTGAGRHARRSRALRIGLTTTVVVGTLSVGGVAAALTDSHLPVLHQLGQVTRTLWGDPQAPQAAPAPAPTGSTSFARTSETGTSRDDATRLPAPFLTHPARTGTPTTKPLTTPVPGAAAPKGPTTATQKPTSTASSTPGSTSTSGTPTTGSSTSSTSTGSAASGSSSTGSTPGATSTASGSSSTSEPTARPSRQTPTSTSTPASTAAGDAATSSGTASSSRTTTSSAAGSTTRN